MKQWSNWLDVFDVGACPFSRRVTLFRYERGLQIAQNQQTQASGLAQLSRRVRRSALARQARSASFDVARCVVVEKGTGSDMKQWSNWLDDFDVGACTFSRRVTLFRYERGLQIAQNQQTQASGLAQLSRRVRRSVLARQARSASFDVTRCVGVEKGVEKGTGSDMKQWSNWLDVFDVGACTFSRRATLFRYDHGKGRSPSHFPLAGSKLSNIKKRQRVGPTNI